MASYLNIGSHEELKIGLPSQFLIQLLPIFPDTCASFEAKPDGERRVVGEAPLELTSYPDFLINIIMNNYQTPITTIQ